LKNLTDHQPSKIFKHATQYFLCADTPNLTKVIPAMDTLHQHLQSAINNLDTHPALVVALQLGKKKLNKYYSATDLSTMYRIAMGKSSTALFLHYLLTDFLSPSSPSSLLQDKLLCKAEMAKKVD
jgi:hypothetical protein